MKKLILLFLSLPIYSQVGIGTTEPTNTLDVNGGLRVRSLTEGTTETKQDGTTYTVNYNFVCAGIFKDNGDTIKTVDCTIRRLNTSTVRVEFINPLPDTNYIINLTGEMRLLYYKLKTRNFFDIILYENNDNSIHNFVVFKI